MFAMSIAKVWRGSQLIILGRGNLRIPGAEHVTGAGRRLCGLANDEGGEMPIEAKQSTRAGPARAWTIRRPARRASPSTRRIYTSMRAHRRLRIGFVAAALVAATASSTLPGPHGAAPSTAHAQEFLPNFVIIVSDDQRTGLEMMPKTQRRLGGKGVSFPNAFTTTPFCCPARASIMTGRYAHNTDVHTGADARKLDQSTTVQHYLQQAGYHTALFGKYLNSWSVSVELPRFDEWAFFNRSKHAYQDGTWNVNGTVKRIKKYSTTYLEHKARRFVESRARKEPSKPWYMYVASAAPHAPYLPERKYRRAPVGRLELTPAILEDDLSDKPSWAQVKHVRPESTARHLRTRQHRTLMSVDDMVGDLVRTLRAAGELDETYIFYISDNGLMWGEHGLAGKAVPYMPAVSVPFLMRAPGGPKGFEDERLVANIDIAPTIMDAAGLQATNAPMDGHSLLDAAISRDRLLLEYYDEKKPGGESRFAAPSWASIQTFDSQFTEYYSPTDHATLQARELYDLVADPYQLVNRLGDTDTDNDPDPLELQSLAVQLARDRVCRGRTGLLACP
ncbi:MAG TPA: sulfatase [Actinomycetota bacterium]|jgi:arylsulfatase A-like enzyme